MHDPQHAHDAHYALAGFFVSAGGATVAYMDEFEQILRMGGSLVAILAGFASFVYYGKRNGWWK